MTAAKAGKYVLLAHVFKQRDEDGAPVRYTRGDTVKLTARQATTLLASNAVAPVDSEQAEAVVGTVSVPVTVAPPVPEPDLGQVAGLAAALTNSGLGDPDASGGVLSDQQLHPAFSSDDGVPPKAATVEVWRQWAVESGKATEEEAAGLTKGALQALAAE